MAYVRFFNKKSELQEEMLFVQNLITDTRRLSIFTTVKSFFEKDTLPLTKIVACATDAVLSMVDLCSSFRACLKKKFPMLSAFIGNALLNLSLHTSLNVMCFIGKIKANVKNDQIFCQICYESDEQFVRLLLHTGVQWLPKGACLTSFIKQYESVVQFLVQYKRNLS